MSVTEFAGDGVLQLFDCLEFVGIESSLRKFTKKKCKELIPGERGMH